MSDLLSESFNNTPSENTHMCTLTLFIGYDSWTDIIAVCTMMLCNTSYQHWLRHATWMLLHHNVNSLFFFYTELCVVSVSSIPFADVCESGVNVVLMWC